MIEIAVSVFLVCVGLAVLLFATGMASDEIVKIIREIRRRY